MIYFETGNYTETNPTLLAIEGTGFPPPSLFIVAHSTVSLSWLPTLSCRYLSQEMLFSKPGKGWQ